MKETAYLLQAALISLWWVGLATNQSFFNAFQFDKISPTAFWAFFAPDIVLIAGLSVVRAYRKLVSLEYVVLGAFGYAALYCFNATILTHSGYLPTGLMLLGLGYNIFLCFNGAQFRNSNSNASFALNVAKTLIQIVCIWILALAVIPVIILDAFETLATPSMNSTSAGSNQQFGSRRSLSIRSQSDGHCWHWTGSRYCGNFSIHTGIDLLAVGGRRLALSCPTIRRT